MLLLAALILAACSGSTPETPEAPVAPGADPALPDIVLITLDTTRADHLGMYGYFRDTSPTIDAIAKTSVVFDRMVVPMATTLPTHTSLLTGTWPLEHGIQANIQHGGARFVPSDQLSTFTEYLAGIGYRTGGFVSSEPLKRGTGIEVGFEGWGEPKRVERTATATIDEAIGWLDTVPATPAFLWVHLYDPHNPFNPPAPYAQKFKRVGDLAGWMDERQVTAVTKRPTGQPVRARQSHDLYDGEIAYMDAEVGRLMEAIDARGRSDNTLLVIVGDHGEGMNQHGEPGHGLVWNEQLRAPLLFRAPGVAPARIDHLVSAVDVLPTALGLVELPGEAAFLAQTSGSDALAATFSPRPVLSQTSERQLQFGRALTFALQGPRFKCIIEGEGEPTLYDLSIDPHELAAVTDNPEEAERCAAEMRQIIAAHKARGLELGSGRTREATDEVLEALQQLGYIHPEEP